MQDKKIITLIGRIAIILFIFEFVMQFAGSYINRIIWQVIMYGKYNREFIAEFIVLILAIIGIIIFKKWNIFKEGKKQFFSTVKMGGPIIFIAIFFLLINSAQLIISGHVNWWNLISLCLFATFVGLFEEIFFRGLIQNELIEKYGESQNKY